MNRPGVFALSLSLLSPTFPGTWNSGALEVGYNGLCLEVAGPGGSLLSWP